MSGNDILQACLAFSLNGVKNKWTHKVAKFSTVMVLARLQPMRAGKKT